MVFFSSAKFSKFRGNLTACHSIVTLLTLLFKCLILLEDINECKTERACGENAECVNNKGSFLCNCKNGYHGNPPSEKCEGKIVILLS